MNCGFGHGLATSGQSVGLVLGRSLGLDLVSSGLVDITANE